MEYALLIYGDEKVWEAADEATRAEVYAAHARVRPPARRAWPQDHQLAPSFSGRRRPGRSAAPPIRSTSPTARSPRPPSSSAASTSSRPTILDDLSQLAGLISYGEPVELRPVVPRDEQA